MSERKRVFILILIMALSSLTVAGITISSLYTAAFNEERERLVETAQSQARMIEAVARFDKAYLPLTVPGVARSITLRQIIEAHQRYEQSNRTMEFTLAEKKENAIFFLLRHRHGGLEQPRPISINSNLAEPMKQALLGNSGTIVGIDYRGEKVLAAHEPVSELDLGIVAKIDLSEIRAPFVKAGLLAGLLGVLVVLAGATLFLRISNPMIKILGEHNAKLEIANEKFKQEIDERKRAQAALHESEARFRVIFEQAAVGVAQIETKSGRFIRINQKYCDIVGYSKKEMTATTFMELSHPDDLLEDLNNMKRLKSGEINEFTMEKRYFHNNGSIVWVDLTVSPMWTAGEASDYHIAVVVDITNRKQAEDALWKSEEKYRLLVENANDAIFIAQDEQVKFSNRKAKQMSKKLGLDLDRVPIADYIHPEDRNMVLDRHRRRLDGEKLVNAYAFRLVGQESQTVWVEVNSVVIDWDGKPASLNFLRDVTVQRKLEEQLQLSQKMEAVGTLAGGIAHDFNNLLMGIQGRTSLMLLEADPFQAHYEHLKEIENYVKRSTELTKQILGFARGGKYEVKPTNLNYLLEKCSRMFGRTKKEIAIYKKYQDGIWTVEVDQSQIDQVLLNIFVNAWQAMPGGGDIYIQSENVALDENFVRTYGVASGKYVRISITDTGMGMDEKTAKRIFDPFFTTKEKERGTGLGLASAYGIIKNHDGLITAESAIGLGTAFNLYLPASEKIFFEEQQQVQNIFTGSETILLVDDEGMIIEVGVQMLQKMGYKVLTAGHGKEAVEIYKQNKGKIAIVILDLIMPEMGGGEVYDRLKKLDSNVKVLLSSGYSKDDQAAEILSRGCDGFIQKPFSMSGLSIKIREILAKI